MKYTLHQMFHLHIIQLTNKHYTTIDCNLSRSFVSVANDLTCVLYFFETFCIFKFLIKLNQMEQLRSQTLIFTQKSEYKICARNTTFNWFIPESANNNRTPKFSDRKVKCGMICVYVHVCSELHSLIYRTSMML